ncbi:hypothetical protein SH528x_002423 [Novipirellula sp. SH528]|uniref:hypothetical protein n=1 Tax=Novipirellula sp. SH528 TaxID=3454466 RepID=UPI003FA05B65
MNRDSTEALEHLHGMIRHLHYHPETYVVSSDRIGTPETLDAVCFYVYRYWAFIQRREDELSESLVDVRAKRECEKLSFADKHRQAFPRGNDEDCTAFVLDCWREVSGKLRMDLERPWFVRPKPTEEDGEP